MEEQAEAVKRTAEQVAQEEAPTIYHWDRETRAYVGSSKADLDPGEYELNDKIVWMLPARATFTPAPAHGEDQVAVWTPETESWAVLPRALVEEDQAPPLELAEQQAAALSLIDSDIDALIFRVIGNRAQEYLQAEAQAQSFKDRGYPEDVPEFVASDAAAFNRTPQEAADAILEQAAAWRGALGKMRRERLFHKQEVLRCASTEDLTLVLSGWVSALKEMAGMLGV